ncbi:MAG: hypothetical protein JSW11_11000 [Candidatus Heimdallarchaeota archaeon]|nr:MAG: hypothetical protein JSW11_11000 [Candidatus Heimdallarchaeota archaeon]
MPPAPRNKKRRKKECCSTTTKKEVFDVVMFLAINNQKSDIFTESLDQNQRQVKKNVIVLRYRQSKNIPTTVSFLTVKNLQGKSLIFFF